jgi:hypothetical protein
LKSILEAMSPQDILEMDKYTGADGKEKHGLVEIITELVALCSDSGTEQTASVAG